MSEIAPTAGVVIVPKRRRRSSPSRRWGPDTRRIVVFGILTMLGGLARSSPHRGAAGPAVAAGAFLSSCAIERQRTGPRLPRRRGGPWAWRRDAAVPGPRFRPTAEVFRPHDRPPMRVPSTPNRGAAVRRRGLRSDRPAPGGADGSAGVADNTGVRSGGRSAAAGVSPPITSTVVHRCQPCLVRDRWSPRRAKEVEEPRGSSTGSCPGSSSTRASSTRLATFGTRSSTVSGSCRSSPTTSMSSSRFASPACASRFGPGSRRSRPRARDRRPSCAPCAPGSSSW
jgi:hypothetical protein